METRCTGGERAPFMAAAGGESDLVENPTEFQSQAAALPRTDDAFPLCLHQFAAARHHAAGSLVSSPNAAPYAALVAARAEAGQEVSHLRSVTA